MGLGKSFSRWILYKCLGWKVNITEEHPDKYIICLAPHTSNWDFLLGQLFAQAQGMKVGFLMKKEWFFWPLGPIFRRLGGIPVWRTKHTSMTNNLAETPMREKVFHLSITPEGTRSLNTEWKKGFYYIALKAQMPILLYGDDYQKKLIQCPKTSLPSGNIHSDIKEIKQYFKNFKSKKPENFTIG